MPQLSRMTGYFEKLHAPEVRSLQEITALAAIVARNTSPNQGEPTNLLHKSATGLLLAAQNFSQHAAALTTALASVAADKAAKLVLLMLCLAPAALLAQDFQGMRSRLLVDSAPTFNQPSLSDYSSDNYRRPIIQSQPYRYYGEAPGCRITRAQLLRERYDFKQVNQDYRLSQIKRLSFEQSQKIAAIGAEMREKQLQMQREKQAESNGDN